MKTTALAIGAWGYPPSWKPATYQLEGRRLTSRSTLDAIVDAVNPDRVLVLIPDTVAPPDIVRSASSYHEVIQGVVGWLYEWIRENTVRLRDYKDLRVEVAPNLGTYSQCSWIAPGCSAFQLYAFHALRAILENLVDLGVEADVVRVFIDTSHGINFMPLATVDALETVATALAASTGTMVEVYVYNSEPYPGGATAQTPVLEVHRVETRVLEPRTSAVEAAIDMLKSVHLREGVVKLKLASAEERIAGVLGRALNAPARELVEHDGVPAAVVNLYGLPLAAAYLAVDSRLDLDMAAELINDAIEAFREYTVVDNRLCRVEHLACLEYEGARALLEAAALMRRVKSAVSSVLEKCPPSLEELEDRGVYLDELSEISARLAPLTNFFMNSELYNIQRMLFVQAGCRCEADGRPPVCKNCRALRIPLYCGDWPGAACIETNIDYRNFLAHGGIEYNSVEAALDSSGTALRYREGCWKRIRSRMLQKAARELAGHSSARRGAEP